MTVSVCMDAPGVSGDGIHLASFRNQPPASGVGLDDGLCYPHYEDRGSLASSHSEAGLVVGYGTLDAPPQYDFYANTEVWGRRKHFRPSLFQLHSAPTEVSWLQWT